MNIIVLNLPRTTKSKDLFNLFSAHGKINSCEIVIDKITLQSKGFGFVEMENDDEANNAIINLHGTNFGGKRIRVKKAQSV